MKAWIALSVAGFVVFSVGAAWRIQAMGWDNTPGWLVVWTFGEMAWLVGMMAAIGEKAIERAFRAGDEETDAD